MLFSHMLLGSLLDSSPNLIAMDDDMRWGLNTQTNAVATHLQNRQDYFLLRQDDFIATLPC
jgi:hypothetical protein